MSRAIVAGTYFLNMMLYHSGAGCIFYVRLLRHPDINYANIDRSFPSVTQYIYSRCTFLRCDSTHNKQPLLLPVVFSLVIFVDKFVRCRSALRAALVNMNSFFRTRIPPGTICNPAGRFRLFSSKWCKNTFVSAPTRHARLFFSV